MADPKMDAIRGVLRSPEGVDLMWQIVDSVDPVWSEDALAKRILEDLEALDDSPPCVQRP